MLPVTSIHAVNPPNLLSRLLLLMTCGPTLHGSHQHSRHPDHPHNTRDSTICLYLGHAGVDSKLKPKTSVDHGESDERATPPDVQVGKDIWERERAFVRIMVTEAKEGLEEETSDYYHTDNRMLLFEVIALLRIPDTHSQASDCHHIRSNLSTSMHPNETWEAEDTDDDGTDGQQEYERDAHYDAVGFKHSVLLCY
jgi:hypothetical protein